MGLSLVAACKLGLWSGRLERMRTPCRALEMPLKRFGYVPSLLQAHPSIDTVSWFCLGP